MFAFHHQGKFMLFSVKSFIEMPTLSSLTVLKRSDVLVLANHYERETSEIRKNIPFSGFYMRANILTRFKLNDT